MYPVLALPEDPSLPELSQLFDSECVWQAYCKSFDEPEEEPQRIRLRQFSYRPASKATVSYVAEWRWDDWITEVQFAIEVTAGQQERVYQYPNDPHLPGLSRAASPLDAHKLINAHVMSTRAVQVDSVRYRPGRRAVMRHIAGVNKSTRVTFFTRVIRPKNVERLISAADARRR